jgi:16S rRNA processing protein RimM
VSAEYLVSSNKFYILRNSQYLPLKITFKNYKDNKILKINDNSDRNEAKLYTNNEFYLDRSTLNQTNTDEYYHVDLIGLKVYDVDNNFIGVIDEIINNNNLDYLKVKLDNDFIIIPFNKKNVNKIEFGSNKLFLIKNNYDF